MRGGVDGELEFALLAVIHGQSFHEERREPGSSAASERVEDEEALQSGAVVSELANSVENEINDLFADCVMTASIIIGSIFLASNELFGVEQLPVHASPDFICNLRFSL